MAAVASRSRLVVALLRNSAPARRTSVLAFLRGLSHDELQCIAEFQGACIIESLVSEAPGSGALVSEALVSEALVSEALVSESVVSESVVSRSTSYRLLPEFFDPAGSERWQNPEERAHKVFILVEWLDQIASSRCAATRSRVLNPA